MDDEFPEHIFRCPGTNLPHDPPCPACEAIGEDIRWMLINVYGKEQP